MGRGDRGRESKTMPYDFYAIITESRLLVSSVNIVYEFLTQVSFFTWSQRKTAGSGLVKFPLPFSGFLSWREAGTNRKKCTKLRMSQQIWGREPGIEGHRSGEVWSLLSPRALFTAESLGKIASFFFSTECEQADIHPY